MTQQRLRKIVTACRTYQIVLTGLCSQKCGHCAYPSKFLEPLPSARKLRRLLRDAVQRKAVGVEFSSGQGIAESEAVTEACRHYGMDSFLDYLEMAARCVEQMATARRSPLIPCWDLGPMSVAELNRLRPALLSIRLSLESVDTSLAGKPVFRDAPAKAPRWQAHAIENAGRARIPVTVTTLVGIGESKGTIERTFGVIAELHKSYGHIQAVCVRGFRPEKRTPMASEPAVTREALVEAVKAARAALPEDVNIQVQAFEHPGWELDLIRAGADDLGDFPLQGTEEQWKKVLLWETRLAQALKQKGIGIRYRLPVHAGPLEKGLYPRSFEARLQRAIAALYDGVSPEHAVIDKRHAFVLNPPAPSTPAPRPKAKVAAPAPAAPAAATKPRPAKTQPARQPRPARAPRSAPRGGDNRERH